jgi:hypothetical protein
VLSDGFVAFVIFVAALAVKAVLPVRAPTMSAALNEPREFRQEPTHPP